MREPEGAAAESRPLTIRDFKAAARRIEPVDWPGSEKSVPLLYLHCDEFQAAYFAARRWFEDQGQDVAHSVAEEPFNLEMGYQLCQRMLLASGLDHRRKLFADAAAVRRELSPNECAFFLTHHAEMQATEQAGWSGELRDRALRAIAMSLGLPMTASPEALVEAVQQRIAG